MSPYIYQAFPAKRYHPEKGVVRVMNPKEEEALGPGWFRSPSFDKEFEINKKRRPGRPRLVRKKEE